MDAAVVQRNMAVVQWDAVVVQRDAAVVQWDAAVVQWDAVVVQQDAAAVLDSSIRIRVDRGNCYMKVIAPLMTWVPYTVVYCRIRPFTTVYDIVYDRIQENTLRIRSPYFAVFLRIRSRLYTIVIRSHVSRRNTVVYGAYMAWIRSYTLPYTIVHDRIRSP